MKITDFAKTSRKFFSELFEKYKATVS